MKISLIIAFYKNIAALSIIIEALSRQTYKNFEVVIAEDDNNGQTAAAIRTLVAGASFQIKHVVQDEDRGFRKTKILNQAVLAAEGEFLVFIDGDCVPQRDFLQAYVEAYEPKTILFGRRVMLGEKMTKEIYEKGSILGLNWLKLLFSDSKDIKYGIRLPFLNAQRRPGVKGCNWGTTRDSVMEVNGFDEDYITPCAGEDDDISWRLLASGYRFKSLRFSALQYHLHHKLNYTDSKVSMSQLFKKMEEKHIRCKNGIEKLS